MPDLNIAKAIPKQAYAEHEGEEYVKDGTQYKVVNNNQVEYVHQEGKKSQNQFKGTSNNYLKKVSENPDYYNKDGSSMSAQEINTLTGVNKIHPDKFKDYNKLVGYTPKQEIVFTNGGENREIQTTTGDNGGGSSTDISEKKYTWIDGESKTGEGDKKSSGSGKKRLFKRIKEKFNKEKVESKTGKYCTKSDNDKCDMDVSKLQGASDKADDKAYNKAQQDRIYRVKKDGTQVLKKEFAPGQWFSEKMETHRINKSKSQGQSSRKKQQRQINRERNKRNRVNSREHQHNNPQNYNKVSNFFNELSYKKDKPKGSRTIEASF